MVSGDLLVTYSIRATTPTRYHVPDGFTITEAIRLVLQLAVKQEYVEPPGYLEYAVSHNGQQLRKSQDLVRNLFSNQDPVEVKVVDRTGHEWIYLNERGTQNDWDWGSRSAGWEPKLLDNVQAQYERQALISGPALRYQHLRAIGAVQGEEHAEDDEEDDEWQDD